MPNASKLFLLIIGAVALAACGRDQSEQNIIIDNNSTATEVEMLPPDESSETPTDQLENGSVDTGTTNAASANSF